MGSQRQPLHPETKHDQLREAARTESERRVPESGWRWRYGWLIVLVEPNGAKHYRHTHSTATWADAIAIRDEEMFDGDDRYEKSWIIQKNEP